MYTEDSLIIQTSKNNRSSMFIGAAVAMVVVVCVGVSSPSFLFTLRSPLQTATSIAPVASTTGTVVQNAATSTRQAQSSSTMNSASVDAQMDDVADSSAAGRGFGLPLVLAGLSMVLLGMASWLVRPRHHEALAFTSGSRGRVLQAAEDGAVATTDAPLKITGPMEAMLTPLGYYEAYELVVAVSPRLSDLEKDDRLATLELLFTQNKCKKVEKVDRGRRLLSYPIKGSIEAFIVLYTFKGPRFMPKLINDWFVGPGVNSDGNVFRCFLCKQRRVKKGGALKAPGEEDMPMWSV